MEKLYELDFCLTVFPPLAAFKIFLFISGFQQSDYGVPAAVFFMFLVLGVH